MAAENGQTDNESVPAISQDMLEALLEATAPASDPTEEGAASVSRASDLQPKSGLEYYVTAAKTAPRFNLAHWFMGGVAGIVCGIACLFVAISMNPSLLPPSRGGNQAALVADRTNAPQLESTKLQRHPDPHAQSKPARSDTAGVQSEDRLKELFAQAEIYDKLNLSDPLKRAAIQITEVSNAPKTLTKAAVFLLHAGDTDTAIRLLRDNALAADVDSLCDWLDAAGMQWLMSNPVEAGTLLQSLDPKPGLEFGRRDLLLVKAAIAAGRADDAGTLVEAMRAHALRAPETGPPFVDAANVVGDFYFKAGRFDEAASAYAGAAAFEDMRPAMQSKRELRYAKFQQASSLLRAGDKIKAAALFHEMTPVPDGFAKDAALNEAYIKLAAQLELVPAPGKGAS